MTGAGAPAPVYLVTGEDPGLLGQAVAGLVATLVAGGDGLVVEEYSAPTRDEPLGIGSVLDACRTPPFLAPRRVVVARDAERVDAAGMKALAQYLRAPLDTTVLVIALARASAPAVLTKALGPDAVRIDAAPARGARGLSEWFAARVAEGPVRLNRDALSALRAHLGEDLARLDGLLSMLESAYGTGARVGVAELEPYLGSAGGIAPWDLTDAIGAGDTAGALWALERMLGGGERHPLQVLATLHRHYAAMLALDGSGISDERAAASATKLAAFPAGKALREARRLGHDKIARAIALLAGADLDLRGGSGLPPGLVAEVLVARLCQLSRTSGPRRRRAGA